MKRTLATTIAVGAWSEKSWTIANCDAPANTSRLIPVTTKGSSPDCRATTPKVAPTTTVVPRTGQPSVSARRAASRSSRESWIRRIRLEFGEALASLDLLSHARQDARDLSVRRRLYATLHLP